MSNLSTKERIIARHERNRFLHARSRPSAQRSNLDLGVDQPSVLPDSSVLEAASVALEAGQTHYVDVPGIAPLREAISAHLTRLGLHGYEPDNVVITGGVQEARFLSIQIIGESFEQIGIPTVVDPGVHGAIGVRPFDFVELPVDEAAGFLPTIQGISDALATGCRLLYLESPSRLTGAAFTSAQVNEIANLLNKHDGTVIWDQGLSPWVSPADHPSLGSVAGMVERAAVIGEVWPGTGLESWYIGYISASSVWVSAIRAHKQVISICTNTPAQFAAVKAAEVFTTVHNEQFDRLDAQWTAARRLASEAGSEVVRGAAVTVIALRPANVTRAAEALERAGFEFADGGSFGAPGVIRLSVRTGAEHENALRELAESAG